MVAVHAERPGDAAAIHAVHAASFPTDLEARLVDLLRAAGRLRVSLVAEVGGAVVGARAGSGPRPSPPTRGADARPAPAW
jgi:putative acetyltransferase